MLWCTKYAHASINCSVESKEVSYLYGKKPSQGHLLRMFVFSRMFYDLLVLINTWNDFLDKGVYICLWTQKRYAFSINSFKTRDIISFSVFPQARVLKILGLTKWILINYVKRKVKNTFFLTIWHKLRKGNISIEVFFGTGIIWRWKSPV